MGSSNYGFPVWPPHQLLALSLNTVTGRSDVSCALASQCDSIIKGHCIQLLNLDAAVILLKLLIEMFGP